MQFSRHIFLLLLLCLSCTLSSAQEDNLIETVIIGSAESPDPVLQRVLELEKAGLVSGVQVMESFPVQIRLRTTQEIIEELESIPRVRSETFN